MDSAETLILGRIKEKVRVELVEGGVEEEEGAAALAAHPITIDHGSHEEDGRAQNRAFDFTQNAAMSSGQ